MRWRSIGLRASLLSGLILVAFAAALFTAYYLSQRQAADRTAVARARSIVMMAEAAMEYTQTKWSLGVYSTERLRQRLANTEDPAEAKRVILDAVPVSNAWQTAQAKQQEAGFRFRPVARNPRNPKYAPDPLERRALAYFDRHPQAEEVHMRDPERNAVRYFRPIHVERSCLKCHGDPANSAKYWGNDQGLGPSGQKMEGRELGSLYGAFEVSVPLDRAQAHTAANLRYGGALAAAMLVLALATVFWTMRRAIVRPLAEAVSRFNRAARDGDLRVRLPERGAAEIADLGRGFNHFLETLGRMLAEWRENAAQLAASSTQLSATSDEITGNARTSSKRVEEVTGSAQEVNNVVQDVATNINEVSDSATRTTTTTKEGMKAVDTAAERITRLKSSSERVDEIIESIEAIAKKTDLLALNAAIEAANAGEQGKGFAVVADEVRKLAEQTSQATGQVNDIVGDLRSQSDSSVQAMDQVQERMKKVLEMIEHTDATANQIAAAAEELAATMSETTDNMGEISSNVDQVVGSVSQIEAAAQELGELAANLRGSVERFQVEG